MTNNKRTEVGKFMAKMRIQHNQSSSDMCEFLGVTRATLSGIEYGHRDMSKSLKRKLIKKYNLCENDKNMLERAIFYSNQKVKIDMTKFTKHEKDTLYKLIRGRLYE